MSSSVSGCESSKLEDSAGKGTAGPRTARARTSFCERHVEGNSAWPGVALGKIRMGKGVFGMKLLNR